MILGVLLEATLAYALSLALVNLSPAATGDNECFPSVAAVEED